MKKNIIFDKNYQNQNGVNVNSVTATNIVVQQVNQTGDLSINGNVTISQNETINGNISLSGALNNVSFTTNQSSSIFMGTSFPTRALIGNQSTLIGNVVANYVTGGSSIVAIGDFSIGQGYYGNVTSVGANSMRFSVGATNCTALGYQSGTDSSGIYNYSTALGAFATITGSNQVVLGTSSETTIIKGKLAIGKTSVTSGYVCDVSGNFNVSGNLVATSYTTSSDRRIKDNITQITETIDNIEPRKYYNKLTKRQEFGVIADEIQEIFPDLVNGCQDGEILQSVNYIQLIALLIKEVKDLKQKINQIL